MKKTYYICDRMKCKECSSDCFHTSDPRHAKNGESTDPAYDKRFVLNESGDYWELYANSKVVERLTAKDKEKYIKVAKQLAYSKQAIQDLKNAETEVQAEQILKRERTKGFD